MATAMVVCLASLGVLAASFNALPSGFFYPVKVTTEQVRLSLTTSEYERAQLRLEYAERRLAEMSSMADRGDAETAVLLAGEATRLIVQTASSTAFGLTDLASGPAALVSADASTGVAPVAALSADRDEAMGVLQAALEAAPEELKPDVQRLMSELMSETWVPEPAAMRERREPLRSLGLSRSTATTWCSSNWSTHPRRPQTWARPRWPTSS